LEEFNGADPVKAEEPMDQQDWVLSACIPLHGFYLFQGSGSCLALHSKTLRRWRDV
jgi:hypothetical protein